MHPVVSISTKKDVGQVNGMAVNVEECEDEFLVLRSSGIKNALTTRSQRSPSSEIEDYLCEEPVILGQKLNPLEYWKVKECQGELRGLCRLAKSFLRYANCCCSRKDFQYS